MGLSEQYVSAGKVTTMALWFVAGGLMITAWVLMVTSPLETWGTAGMLAATGCVAATGAAVIQIRTYMVRVCSLIRVTSGLNRREGDEGLRSVR